ncbi:MAG: DUF2637 domain-containing protein [Streptosporangiaceae bacterium]|jgi:hypothetical protein
MSDHFPAQNARGGEGPRSLRMTALIAVIIGVLALAAAAFVLSYPGIHALALQTGVSRSLARVYPLIIDAMLVVACAAVLSMRGAGLVSRVFAWLSLLVLLAAAALADALHATAARLPARPAAAVFAVLPWALVLIAFGLLIAMLRQARMRWLMSAGRGRAARRNGPAGQPGAVAGGESGTRWEASPDRQPAAQAGVPALPAAPGEAPARQLAGPEGTPDGPAQAGGTGVPGVREVPAARTALEAAGPGSREPGADAADAPSGRQHDGGTDLAVDAEPALDDPSSDETSPAVTLPRPWTSAEQRRDSAEDGDAGDDGDTAEDESESVGALSPAPTADEPAPEPGLPVFRRVRSLPIPPGEE